MVEIACEVCRKGYEAKLAAAQKEIRKLNDHWYAHKCEGANRIASLEAEVARLKAFEPKACMHCGHEICCFCGKPSRPPAAQQGALMPSPMGDCQCDECKKARKPRRSK